ncbi:MAG: hypothetical protein V4671_08160 [Armatimonadota bacterium]
MRRQVTSSGGAGAEGEAEALRHHFIQAVKQKKTQDNAGRHSEYGDASDLERDTAQQAFCGWTYTQIARWAEENGVTVDFLSAGALRLRDFDYPPTNID